MRKIDVVTFCEECMALLDSLRPDGLVITKHGRPVARVIPCGPGSAFLIGSLREKIEIRDNLKTTGIAWDSRS